MTAGSSVVSGNDWRKGGAPYINFLASPRAGMAMHGHDGYVLFAILAAGASSIATA